MTTDQDRIEALARDVKGWLLTGTPEITDALYKLAQAVLDLSAELRLSEENHADTARELTEAWEEITRLKREVNAEIRYCNSLQNSAWRKLLTYPEVEEA